MGVMINGKRYGDVADETRPKPFKGIPGKSGQFLRTDIPNQIYEDIHGRVKFMSGQFVTDDLIKRFHINPAYFVHPDTMRIQGGFEFAYKNKGKFSVGIIRDMNGRGDVLMASVICKALKYQYGDAVTTMMCVRPGYEDILYGNDYVDQIFTDRDLMDKGKPDIRINVNDLEFKTEVKLFEQSDKILKNRATIYLEQMGLFLDNKTPHYFVSEAEREWATEELKNLDYDLDKPIIGIQLHGSNLTRTYPHMWQVMELLTNEGYQVLTLDIKNVNTDKYVYNLRQAGALIEQMDTTVTPNSYMYHLAGAMKKRAIAIFGSCEGNVWVQDYEKVTAIDSKCPGRKTKCWWTMPCLPGKTLREKEKAGETPDCLMQLKPEVVFDEVHRQLKEPKKVLVVVLTYNLSYLTKQMIDSVRSFHNYDLLVLDNASTDDTVDWCKAHGIEVQVKAEPVNKAWNKGLKEAYDRGYDYVLLCNNDCILSPNYVDILVEVAERRQAYAVTGQVINKSQGTELDFPKFARELEKTQSIMVAGDYSALLISRKCIEKIGGFKYFAPRYQCDEDHLLRLRLSGHTLIKVYATTFFHKHGCAWKENKEFSEASRDKEWKLGVHNFKKEWGINIYEDRKKLNSLQDIKDNNPDWEDRIFRPFRVLKGKMTVLPKVQSSKRIL